ncbi:transmembrane 220 family protein [Pontibacter anaerobius]|uniref:Transmembrane 220 family protein n=1 Tax=Pontibacter anaerobius TaxID=2993940 RepID=A0ABT3RHP4_9BACT|nr:transmembrane 220 family protein [Pontibacter anaerobius]MCX2741139.1 transmembrane 220 family protein [Pontibacter anaerobius]
MLLKKIAAILFGLMFLSFVVVQYNDPDPVIWMIIYGAAALLCFLSAAGKAPAPLLWVAAVLFAVGGIYMWPERFEGVSIGGGDIKNIEEARESLGLFLATLIFAGLALSGNYKSRRTSTQTQHQKTK